MIPTRDWCNSGGAYDLAERIQAYWAKRGYHVQPAVGCEGQDHRQSVWIVRSDMVNGMPTRKLTP